MPHVSWVPRGLIDDRVDAGFYSADHLATEQSIRRCQFGADKLGNNLKRVFKGAFYVLAEEYQSKGIPFLRVTDITKGYVDTSQCVYLTPETHMREKKTAVAPGFLLFAKGGSIGNCAVVPETLPCANISQDLIGAVPMPRLDSHYAIAFLNSRFGVSQMIRWAQGNVHPHITNDAVRNLLIPVPPSPVQHAIGNLIRKAELALTLKRLHLGRVRQLISEMIDPKRSMAHFADADYTLLGGVERTSAWVAPGSIKQRIDASYYQERFIVLDSLIRKADRVKTLGELAPTLCNGPHGGITYVSEKDGIRYIRAKDLYEHTVKDDDMIWISTGDHERHVRGEVVPGDLVITITGANIGAVAVVPETIPRANIIQSLAKARIESDEDPYYVCAFLASPFGQMLIRRESVNTAREGINFEYLAGVPIPMPKSAQQPRFREHMKAAEAYGRESLTLIATAAKYVEAMIDGTLDEAALVNNDAEIEAWLAANRNPELRRV